MAEQKTQGIITADPDGFVEVRVKEGRQVTKRMMFAGGQLPENWIEGLKWLTKHLCPVAEGDLVDQAEAPPMGQIDDGTEIEDF